MEPNKHSIGSIIAGILFLIVFIGGMIGIYIGTTDDIRISIISLGAILLAVGIAAISSAVKQKGSKKVLPVTISPRKAPAKRILLSLRLSQSP